MSYKFLISGTYDEVGNIIRLLEESNSCILGVIKNENGRKLGFTGYRAGDFSDYTSYSDDIVLLPYTGDELEKTKSQLNAYGFHNIYEVSGGDCSFTPEVSVIIPVYNTAKYLERCLSSILNQKFNSIEVICIDDGSNDGSKQLLSKYANVDSRVRYFSGSRNCGAGYCKNMGVQLARGKYICFVDSDDWMIGEAISELYNIAEENKADGVFYELVATNEFKNNEKPCGFNDEKQSNSLMIGEVFLEKMLNSNSFTTASAHHFVKGYKIKNRISFSDRSICDDLHFTIDLLLNNYNVVVSKRKLYAYFQGNEQSITKRTKDINYCYDLGVRALEIIEKTRQYEEQEKIRKRLFCYHWVRYLRLCNYLEPEEKEKLDQMVNERIKLSDQQADIEILLNNLPTYGSFKFESVLDSISTATRRYIWGAGNYSFLAYVELKKMNISIDGFIVSEIDNNPKQIDGIEVIRDEDHREQLLKDNALVLIAVGPKLREVIRERVDQAGYNAVELPLKNDGTCDIL